MPSALYIPLRVADPLLFSYIGSLRIRHLERNTLHSKGVAQKNKNHLLLLTNSSLEQLGCGFDWITNTCKDVFAIGWCGQCHDFGNIFVHDCKCVRPLIVLQPRPQQAPRPVLFNMI
ncbi:unnamed protein product [Strongylus vulgaris]|uniref:Uncharacterized protein n=1 Tax=Strongylus vulgaris TaxID=40348 RepID=A0A3P7KAU4_STRVU|nr:unnamed protein product [Strongylus vulgaris]